MLPLYLVQLTEASNAEAKKALQIHCFLQFPARIAVCTRVWLRAVV